MAQFDTLCFLEQYVRVTQTRTLQGAREVPLEPGTRTLLEEIGIALDEQRPLRVFNNGIVAVDQEPFTASFNEEKDYERRRRQRKRRSKAGARKRSARRKRSPSGSRSAATESRIGRYVLRADYEGQLADLREAYPTLRTFADDGGMWLLARSSILQGLGREAIFLVALPYQLGLGPRAWGFWTTSNRSWWIGPRHTNFFGGSICAFSPKDGIWSEGGDLRMLINLYTGWAIRHLHLEVVGRWPGKQYAILGADPQLQAYYRLRECMDNELCGCGSNSRRYADCCKPSDSEWNQNQLRQHFLQHVEGGFETRKPPTSVKDFVEAQNDLPRIADVLFQIVSS